VKTVNFLKKKYTLYNKYIYKMESIWTLIRQPTPVLVALFNQIDNKIEKNGTVCVQICEILNRRGYDLSKLNY